MEKKKPPTTVGQITSTHASVHVSLASNTEEGHWNPESEISQDFWRINSSVTSHIIYQQWKIRISSVWPLKALFLFNLTNEPSYS